MINNFDKILEKIKQVEIADIRKKYTFRLPILNFLINTILLGIFAINIYKRISIGYVFEWTDLLLLLILFYIIYIYYQLFSHKIIIENESLKYKNINIDLKKVDKINLIEKLSKRGKKEIQLQIISEKNEYCFELNLSKKYEFIALISKISGKKVLV